MNRVPKQIDYIALVTAEEENSGRRKPPDIERKEYETEAYQTSTTDLSGKYLPKRKQVQARVNTRRIKEAHEEDY